MRRLPESDGQQHAANASRQTNPGARAFGAGGGAGSTRQTLKTWLTLAFEAHTVRRALGYAAVIGAVLIAINHYELLTGEQGLTLTRITKIVLTVIVPYVVSTSSSVGAQLACGVRRHMTG